MLKVCVISPLYHLSLGGIGRQAQLLSEKLTEKGVSIFVIARRMKGMPSVVFEPKVCVYRAWSLKPYLHNLEEVRLVNILVSLTFSMSCALFLLWNRKDYDIVHFHGASLPLILNLPLLKFLKKKAIAKVAAANIGTEAGSLKGRYFIFSDCILRIMKKTDLFIATTAEIVEGLHRDGLAEKVRRIPNFIEPSLFSPPASGEKPALRRRWGLPDKLIVTFSGRFVERKGIKFLVKAWQEVIEEFPDARLVMLGDGTHLSRMKTLAEQLSIDEYIFFKGQTDDVADFLRTSDVYVLPSLQEGMPNSLLEAMACGLPVIASRIGGVVDVVEDGKSGILFEAGDVSGLASAMVRLLNDSELRLKLGTEARRRVVENFSIDRIADEYIKLYKEVLN